MADDRNQVRPDYGPQPKGKANIMRQGQTELGSNTFGQDPGAMHVTPEVKDNPDL